MKGRLQVILRSRFEKKELLASLQGAPSLVEELVHYACADEQPISWRAAWMLEHHAKAYPDDVARYASRFIDVLEEKEDGHQRCLIKLLMELDLDDEQQSKLFNSCFNIYENLAAIPSLRITALQYIISVVKEYPELRAEVLHLFDERYSLGLSPGIKNSWMKLKSTLS